VRERTLRWDGCQNVRDLGGHPTEDGDETRYGSVVRSDSVRELSDEGWAALVEYGVRRIVDLRADDELAEDAPRDLPVEVVHVPLIDEEVLSADRLAPPIDDAVERRRRFYWRVLEERSTKFAEAVAAVAQAPEGPVVVHCAGGVDRTGLVTALLLRLAGVGHREIADDYAESERNWAAAVPAWIEDAPTEELREYRRYLSKLRPEVMLRVLADLEDQCGGADSYLLAAGASSEDLERVRARLRQ
jgi:protein-tyrosine phosphatase